MAARVRQHQNKAVPTTAGFTSTVHSLAVAAADLTAARAFALAGRVEAEPDMLGASGRAQLLVVSRSNAPAAVYCAARHDQSLGLTIRT